KQFTRQGRQSIQLIIGPAILDDDVLTLDKASFFEALAKSTQTVLDHRARRSVVEEPDHRHCRLLRARRERPRRRTAEQRDELAAFHSITSSAPAVRPSGTSRPSAFAVFKLITNSNLVVCITGSSAGFSPLRIRPT